MGASSAEVFDDDIAMDVRATFEEALSDGSSVEEATKIVLGDFSEVLEDTDDGSIIYLALAALPLEQGTVEKNILDRAINIIDSGQDLERWEGTDKASRKNVLESLKAKLEKAKLTE